MANILIATLGDHPAVVTGMVKMLKAKKNIALNEVVVFHTEGSGKLISLGYNLVEATLKDHLSVIQHKLPFADPTSRGESIQFLYYLNKVLNDYDKRGDTVYLSLAGGRKNMSALMAVICQFYPSVKGLFHLITHSDSAFPSIEQLVEMNNNRQQRAMNPPIEEMTLVEIPYQTLSNAVELRRYFAAEDRGDVYTIELTLTGEQFLKEVFQPARLTGMLGVYFSRTAYEQLQKFSGDRYKSFIKYFEQMRDPYALKSRRHGTFSFEDKVFHFMKLRQTGERPFFYTTPNPIHTFPSENNPVKKVIVCGLSVKKTNSVYQPDENYFLNLGDFSPFKSLSELNKNQLILVVPLGESPMVASQTYTLLQQTDREWDAQKVTKVVALYPEQNEPIKNGAKLLKKAFKKRQIAFEAISITGLRDVNSLITAKIYRDAIIRTVDGLRKNNPDKTIALSLSGGRKGMSALTLFAAQGVGVSQVYHTTITDPTYEQTVFQETTSEKLTQLGRDKLARILFLDEYDLTKFTLFEVPVINFKQEIAL